MAADWLVVGAGLTGATFAERLASQLGQRVLVVDRRPHLAGNAHDAPDDKGLLVHRYGAHIFHTTSARVWTYLSAFTDWRPYQHRVLGDIDGHLVPIPFNLTTLHALVPGPEADRLQRRLVEAAGPDGAVPVLKLMEAGDPELRRLGHLVYDKVFARYSAKQWGCAPEELDRSVTGRVPVVASHDDRYFHDRFQGIPTGGYTAMVSRMLDHPGITVALGTDYREVRAGHDHTVFTGPLDELFDYRFGPLPYRSLRFETVHAQREQVQPVAVVNYPDDRPYTRTIEHKHLTGQRHRWTAVTTEWPVAHVPGVTEPYYPVPTRASRACYDAYRHLAETELPGVVLAGRLADYRYYNMDQAVNRALVVFRERIVRHRRAPAVTA